MGVRALGREDRQRVLPRRQRRLLAAGVRERCRVGERAEHADPQTGEARLGARHVGQHLERQRALLHRPRHRPGVVEAGHERVAAVERDEPVARLEAGRAAGERGDADRAAGVGADAQRGEPRRERRGAAAGGAACDVAGTPRVADGAVERVLARDAPGELVQVGLADDHRAGVDDALHRARAARGHVLAEDPRPVGGAQTRRVEEILGRERHAGERPEPALAAQRAGVEQRALAVDGDEGVEVGPRLDAVEVVLDDLLGGDVPGAYALGDLMACPLVHGGRFYQNAEVTG